MQQRTLNRILWLVVGTAAATSVRPPLPAAVVSFDVPADGCRTPPVPPLHADADT